MDNVIGRVNLELNTVDSGDGLVLQEHVAQWAQEELVPTLERILDDWPAGDDVVWVDRLDIELQPLAVNGWQAATLDELRRELSVSLRRRLEMTPASHTAPVEASNGSSAASGLAIEPASGDGVLSALLHYLRHGHLPWYWSATESFEAVTQRWLDTASTAELSAALLPALQSQDAARRFVRGLSNESLQAFVERWITVPSGRWSEWQRDIRSVGELIAHASAGARTVSSTAAAIEHRTAGHDFPEMFWVQFLAVIAGAAPIDDLRTEQPLHDPLFRAIANFMQIWIQPSARPLAVLDELRRLSASHRHFATGEFRHAIVHLSALTQTVPGAGDRPATANDFRAAQRVPSAVHEHSVSREASSAEPQGQFVTNAGLVLLGPYLRMYLERLGLVENTRLTDAAAALVAVQYLATGQASATQEYELALPKILCGIALDEVPPSLPPVGSDVAREADELLNSIVEHWAVLKSTSADSLREAFLCRDGKLVTGDDGSWLLQVEHKPYDMLLSSLPWSYRMTRLPWMDRMLITQWVG